MTKSANPSMDTLAEFIRAACFLRKETIGRESTAAFLRSNPGKARVLYALDTNIIKTYADPITRGPRDLGGGNGAGYIFPSDDTDKESQIKLAAALSNFVCYELSPHDLMYQLPGHSEETARVYSAVALKLEARGRPDYEAKSKGEISTVAASIEALKSNPELKGELHALAERLSAASTQIAEDDQVTSIIDRIVNKILSTSRNFNHSEREYLNYLRLLLRRGLMPLGEASRALAMDANDQVIARAFGAAELDKRTFEEVVRHNQLVTLWMARIGSLKSKTTQRRFADDADALACLDLVNRRFASLNSETRLVLITADSHLVEAASRRIPFGEKEDRGFGSIYFRDFSRKYVQHLHAFLSECLIDTNAHLVDGDGSQFEEGAAPLKGRVVGWLDAFLGEKAGMTEFDPETLARIAYEPREVDSFAQRLWSQLGDNGSDFRVILDQWHAIRDQASNRELFVEQIKRQDQLRDAVNKVLLSSLQNHHSNRHDGPVEFLALAANTISENLWETFVLSLSQPGARLVVADDSNRSRNPPDIRFDSLKNSAAIVSKLLKPNGFAENADLEAAFAQLREDTLDDMPGNNALGYLYYLMMAAIFAKNSRWSVTYTLVQRAIAIVESFRRRRHVIPVGEPSHISGREAYFVAASAKRLLARNWQDFRTAEDHLMSARAALVEDHRAGSALAQKGRRFNVEQIALELSRFYWARHNEREMQGFNAKAEMYSALQRALQTCHNLYREMIEDDVEGDGIRRPTLVNFWTNFAQIAVAVELMGSDAPALPNGFDPAAGLRKVIKTLEECTVEGGVVAESGGLDHKAVNRTYLMKVYLIASRVLVGELLPRREISALFSDQLMVEHSITRYDHARFIELRRFCFDRSKR